MQKRTKRRLSAIFIIAGFSLISLITSCKKDNNAPQGTLKITPSTGSVNSDFNIDVSASSDQEDAASKLLVRFDWENDGSWDTDWISEKSHIRQYTSEGDYTVHVEVKDTEGQTHKLTENLTVNNGHHLVPTYSPFSYNVGINYESQTWGRDHRIIANDLDMITQHFKLIRTYHAAGVGTSDTVIEPTQESVIKYIIDNPGLELELAMGTNTSALVKGGFGAPYTSGFMTTKTYTDKWVEIMIDAFGSKENMQKYLKVILLGNEVDQNAPLPGDQHYEIYYKNWVPKAFDNLKASLADASMPEIPISTTIANYNTDHPDANIRADSITAYIQGNWDPAWNNGNPFVMFNQYTLPGKSTDFGHVIKYIDGLFSYFNDKPDVYVGETGYSAEYGLENEENVVKQIFSWLQSQYHKEKLTIPLFIFMAYDRSAKGVGQKKMGIFEDDSQNKPVGLKGNIQVPAWVKEKKN